MYYNQYLRAGSLEEAYDLVQKKNNVIIGGMLWLKMQDRSFGTAIDLCDLGLDQIEDTEEEIRIGAFVSLRRLETDEILNRYTGGAMKEAMRHIVGVQFRNGATVGGSIYGKFGFSDVFTIFLALGAKVKLQGKGVISLQEFASLPRDYRDVLIQVIVPKKELKVVYITQRNTKTDFPVLTCAVVKDADGYKAVIGAYPHLATMIADEEQILAGEITEAVIKDFSSYVASRIPFGSNTRASAEYREQICKVLVKRAVQELNETQEEA